MTMKESSGNLDESEMNELQDHFSQCDMENEGRIDVQDLFRACRTKAHSNVRYEDVQNAVKEMLQGTKDAKRNSGTVSSLSREEFLAVAKQAILKAGQRRTTRKYSLPSDSFMVAAGQVATSEAHGGTSAPHAIRIIAGSTSSTQHSIDEEEKNEFTHHINSLLKGDPDVASKLPLTGDDLFFKCRDGWILNKLINAAVPDTIDERVLNRVKGSNSELSAFHLTENNNLIIESAKAIGCSVVNIGATDLIEGRPHLVLGLVWQIIKIGLLAPLSLPKHPELYRLLKANDEETLESLLSLPPERLLLRWVNFHLQAAGSPRRLTNFTSDLQDSEVYTYLLHQLFPRSCSLDPLQESDWERRAEAVLEQANTVGCRRYLTTRAILSGHPRLNMAFLASLFDSHPGLAPLLPTEQATLDDTLFGDENTGMTREAQVFRLWLNSLPTVSPSVMSLFSELKDGRVLLQAMNAIHPGLVDMKKVHQAATYKNKDEQEDELEDTKTVKSRFKCLENNNYVVRLAHQLGFSLVGIQGSDLMQGHEKLTLAIVWQLMREHVIQTLTACSKRKGGQKVTESDLIEWANGLVRSLSPSNETVVQGKPISSLRDPSLKTSHFYLMILDVLSPGMVQWSLVTPGESDKDAKLNAKYAISMARKLGVTLFCLPQDLIAVKNKMILTFLGSLMAYSLK